MEVAAAIDKFYNKASPLWEPLSKEFVDNIFTHTSIQPYKKNTTIVNDFEYPAGMYIVRKGFVKIYSVNPSGTEDIVFILGKGLFFGVTPIFNNERFGIFATAITDCEIEVIPKDIIKNEMENSSEFNHAMVLHLAQMTKMLKIKLLDFARKPLLERIVITLLSLDKKLDLNGTLAFSREDLANYIGTAVESLVRQLKILKTNNLIIVKGRKITLIDYKGLIKIVSEA